MTVPFFSYSPLSPPATTKEIDLTFAYNETGYLQWYMNNQTFRANYEYVQPSTQDIKD